MSQPSELFVICSYRAHGSIITPVVAYEDELKAEQEKELYMRHPSGDGKYIIQKVRVYR